MGTIENINIKDIDRYISDDRYIIIDVRSEDDYRKRHIKGAVNIPYAVIESEEIEIPKNRIPVIYCEHGGISIMAAKKLYRRGYKVINTLGGISVYERSKQKL